MTVSGVTASGRAVSRGGASRRAALDGTAAGSRIRRWRAAVRRAGRVAMPYGFAAAGLALGAGGIVEDRPIAGAAGAVAGVTAGLLYLVRARRYRQQFEALADQLFGERAQSRAQDGELAQLRQRIAVLEAQLWEQHALALLRDPSTGSIPIIVPSPKTR